MAYDSSLDYKFVYVFYWRYLSTYKIFDKAVPMEFYRKYCDKADTIECYYGMYKKTHCRELTIKLPIQIAMDGIYSCQF